MVLAHNVYDGQRTHDVHIYQDITFDTMLLLPKTLEGLKSSGFYKPSPIQLHGIPLGKCGFDLLLEAKSGTGKTAVFSVIALEKIDLSGGLQVIILAPTREIAMQICDVLKQIGSNYKGLQIEVVMGGLPLQDDIEKFSKNVHIIVGSPGRLKHLIKDKYINTSGIRLLILDEADKLMEKSFQADINYIYGTLPGEKQVIMSSATYPENSKSFIKKYVQNAQHICPDTNSILLGIDQKVCYVKYNSNIVKQTQTKFKELLKIITNKQFKQCLIFCNYQVRVCELHKMLTREKWPSELLYGKQEQTDRLDALKTLQEYKCRILISTDLAARGIDASNVDLVINFEPPFEWQTYLHRIGRAGRYGSYGVAITILSEGTEENKFKQLLESIKLPIKLSNLWTNDEYCISDIDHQHHTNIDVSENHELQMSDEVSMILSENHMHLWKVLTGDLKNKEPVTSFEELNKSYNDSEKVEIEVFNDLLCSYENDKESQTEEESEYQCISVIPVKENRKSYHNQNETFKKLSYGVHYPQNSIEDISCDKKYNGFSVLNGVKSNLSNANEQNINKSVINQPHIKTLPSLQSGRCECSVNVQNKNSVSDNQSNNLYEDNEDTDVIGTKCKKNNFEFDSNNVTDALISSGLPTSFSSSKYVKLSKKSQVKYYEDQNELEKRQNHKQNIYSNKNCIRINKNVYKNSLKDTEDNLCFPVKDNLLNKYASKSECDYQSCTKKQYLNFNTKSKCVTGKAQSNKATQYENKRYIDWYRQLKLRMKQIEMIAYLNEISQL